MYLGLSQPEAAEELGVDRTTILHWEKHGVEPAATFGPQILRFLGYDPYPELTGDSELLVWLRWHNGEELPACPERIGVSANTLWRWEASGEPEIWRSRYLLHVFLAFERARLRLGPDFGKP